MDQELKDKINEIYTEFTKRMDSLIYKRKELLKTYRQKLEEAKIKEVKDSILKQ